MNSLNEIESEKYISLETYRKNNQPVRTPVWFVIKNDLIYVVTRDQTGKVKCTFLILFRLNYSCNIVFFKSFRFILLSNFSNNFLNLSIS